MSERIRDRFERWCGVPLDEALLGLYALLVLVCIAACGVALMVLW